MLGRRVAIIAGVRTPFARAGTAFKDMTAIELGKRCVAELIQRTNLDGDLVEAIVYGTVVPSVVAPNIAREVSLMPMLPRGCDAYTVSRACASANQAITDAADQIALGHHDVVIAGGAESLSNVPILHSRGMSDKLVALSRAKSPGGRIRIIGSVRPRDLVPITPAIAEPSTGESMGQSAEKMAKINHISREEQAIRLKERKTNPKKYWKHSDDDWKTRRKWDEYMKAYEILFKKCNEPEWTIIPADQNWYKEYLVAAKVCETLKKMKLVYPPFNGKK